MYGERAVVGYDVGKSAERDVTHRITNTTNKQPRPRTLKASKVSKTGFFPFPYDKTSKKGITHRASIASVGPQWAFLTLI